jgi:hypothetical protein
MKSKSLYVISALILSAALSCSDDNPVTLYDRGGEATLILAGEPIDTVYITSLDSVSENYSSSYTVRCSDISSDAYSGLGLPYAWVGNESAVTAELVADENGSIDITITGCRCSDTWMVFHDDPADLQLEDVDSVSADGYTYDISWRYTVHEPGKGYINFAQVPTGHAGTSRRSLGILYTHECIDTIRVSIDSVTWHYAITETRSDLDVVFGGNTNCHRMLGENYGDGVISIFNISLGGDGSFSRRIWLRFIYKGDSFLDGDARLYIIGTVGMPKVVRLKNPLNASRDAPLIP